MNLRVATVLLVTSACGRFHFDDVHDAGVGDADSQGDGGGPPEARCTELPRPDTSLPDVLFGTNTPASCTAAGLQAALDLGGTIAENCGSGPVTVNVTTELVITRDVVFDGRGLLTLNGGASRMFRIAAPGAHVTLLDVTLKGALSSGDGGAVLVESGSLRVFGTTFADNTAVGQGGAIMMVPTAGSLEIVGSSFSNNTAGAGGAVWAADQLVIQNSTFTGNGAIGGAGLGGAIAHEGAGDLSLCGATFDNNQATSLGGAIHRVCTNAACTDAIERTSITNNMAQNAGGAYIQDSLLSVRQTSIVTNTATTGSVGGIWYVGTRGFTGEQLSVIGNTALTGLGAGLNLGAAPGTLSFVTLARNMCSNVTCDSGGLEATASLAVRASLIANNTTGGTGVTCRTAASDGTDTFQWPSQTGKPCATASQFTDPLVGATITRTGPRGSFLVAPPMEPSPARGVVTDCPAEDQVGNPRPVPCTAGAVEP